MGSDGVQNKLSIQGYKKNRSSLDVNYRKQQSAAQKRPCEC